MLVSHSLFSPNLLFIPSQYPPHISRPITAFSLNRSNLPSQSPLLLAQLSDLSDPPMAPPPPR
ncbi:hypothetical protein Scep_028151 [Stephania cephalantha]|uniref:Uncharacterized protein n=1 Tax=Stephania cephalantha TaxID=152367 RepID=A0AAP0HJ97_9MAGN